MRILDINALATKLPKVTCSKILKRNIFHPEGLFSEQIFGPVSDHICQCKIKNTSAPNTVCSKCGVTYTSSIVRRKKCAIIDLSFSVLHPTVYLDLKKRMSKYKECFDKTMNGISFYTFDEDGNIKEEEFGEKRTIEEFYQSIEKIVELTIPETYGIIKEKCGSVFVKSVLVIPPYLRPVVVTSKEIAKDKINDTYIFCKKSKSSERW